MSSSVTPLLKHAKEVIDECLKDPENGGAATLDGRVVQDRLNPVLFAAISAGRNNTKGAKLSEAERADLWHIVCKLWNVTVERHNMKGESEDWSLKIRQSASDLLELIDDEDLSDEERMAKLTFYYKTACAHADLKEYEAAEASLGKAQQYGAALLKEMEQAATPDEQLCEFAEGFLDVLIARARNAWKLQQQEMAMDVFSSAAELAQHPQLPSRSRFHLCRSAILALIEQGVCWLEEKEHQALSLLDNAYKLLAEHLELDEDDAEFETYQKEACSLQAQVLRLLAEAYLLNEKPGPALQCVQNLRKLDPEYASHQTVLLSAIRAYVQMAQVEKAETELLDLAASSSATSIACNIEAFSAVLAANGSPENLKAAADLIIQRFSSDTYVVTKLVEIILGREEVSLDDEELVLHIAGAEPVVEKLTQESAKQQRKSLYTMLWNQSVQHFRSKGYGPAAKLLSAALMYADASDKTVVARQLALCKMGESDLDRAMEYLDISSQQEPGSIYTMFVRVKVMLMKGAVTETLQEVHKMIACEDFQLDFLRVVCQEAVAAKKLPVVTETLQMLHDLVTTSTADGKPGEEACILRNLIQMTAEAGGFDLTGKVSTSKPSGDYGEGEGGARQKASVFEALSGVYSKAVQRLESAGYSQVFGEGQEQIEWFAHSAYNAGSAAGKSKDHMSAAVLMGAAGTFYSAFPKADTRSLISRQNAYLAAASNTLEAHRQRPEHAASLSLAMHMLHQAQQAADAIKLLPHSSRDNSTELARCRKSLLLMELDVAIRQGNDAVQMELLERCKSDNNITPEDFVHAAELCQCSKRRFPATEKAALTAALDNFIAQEHPSYKIVAQTARKVLELSTDAEKLTLLPDIVKLVKSLQPGSYPPKELLWIVTSAWNRGCSHAKYTRMKQALPFMEAALELLDFCPELAARKQDLVTEKDRVLSMIQGTGMEE